MRRDRRNFWLARMAFWAVTLWVTSCSSVALAHNGVKKPTPSALYDVEIRFEIRYDRDQRIREFDRMLAHLRKIGFKESDPDILDDLALDPSAEDLSGTLPAGKIPDLLLQPSIQCALVTPAGYEVPDDPQVRLKVSLKLATGFALREQRLFSEQTVEHLRILGFQEAIGYDHEQFTRLKGTIPSNHLRLLLKDLRGEPSGWLVPEVPYHRLPSPFSKVRPIRLIEVIVDPQDAPPALAEPIGLPPIPDGFPHFRKLAPEIRLLLADAEAKTKPLRFEVLLSYVPNDTDRTWRTALLDFDPTLNLEGRIGNVVTLSAPQAGQAADVAQLEQVLTVRLPRSGLPSYRAADYVIPPNNPVPKPAEPKEEKKDDNKSDSTSKLRPRQLLDTSRFRFTSHTQYDPRSDPLPEPKLDVLSATHLDQLHRRGFEGGGVRIVVIDSDFQGARELIGKEFPSTTLLIDLTAERNASVLPEPYPENNPRRGNGTHCALLLRKVAPSAQLILVRVDASALHHVISIAEAIRGGSGFTVGSRFRLDRLEVEATELSVRKQVAAQEYQQALNDFTADEVDGRGPQVLARRERAKAALDQVLREQDELRQRFARLEALRRQVESLRGADVVVCNLAWNAGYPLDGGSPASRTLDELFGKELLAWSENQSKNPSPGLLWLQSVGDSRGQTWTGTVIDLDGNGVLEFAPRELPLPPDRWSKELNFLGFQPHGTRNAEVTLPPGARLRITMQWREIHDPAIPEDAYLEPLVPIRLLLLRQRDPSGTKVANDEMELVMASDGISYRLLSSSTSGVYEQTVEWTVPAEGRYAVRIEARVPRQLRPAARTMPALERDWELKARLFVEALDNSTRSRGRPVFADYVSRESVVPVPADARAVIAVGAADATKRPRYFSPVGGGMTAELHHKPNILMYDQFPGMGANVGPARGADISATIAAGIAASLRSAGMSNKYLLPNLEIRPGTLLEIPPLYLQKLRPRE